MPPAEVNMLKQCTNCEQEINIFGTSLNQYIGHFAAKLTPLWVKIQAGLPLEVTSTCSSCSEQTTWDLDQSQPKNIVYNPRR